MHDPIIEELHRHREDLLREHGNDPEALVRYLQEREQRSGHRVQAPTKADTAMLQDRFARR